MFGKGDNLYHANSPEAHAKNELTQKPPKSFNLPKNRLVFCGQLHLFGMYAKFI
jgi:hypothetical protein